MAKPTKRPTKRRIDPVSDKVMPTGKPREAVRRVSRPGDDRVVSPDRAEDDDTVTDASARSTSTKPGTGSGSGKAADTDAAASGTKARQSALAASEVVKPSRRELRRQNKRVTPKGGPSASHRYTPPSAHYEDMPSPLWVPILMFTLFALGMLTIFLNYVGLLPAATSNWYLLLGLGFILGGIITATQYR